MGKIRVAGYVKLAKLWEKNRDKALPYHQNYYEEKYRDSQRFDLVGVYVDITGAKQIAKRPEMIRLIGDCYENKVDCIAVQTKGYLAADTREFCYLYKLLSDIRGGIHIITEDLDYNINTIQNSEGQREELLKMANEYIALAPDDYKTWKTDILKKCSLGGGEDD